MKAGDILNIKVIDYVIVTQEDFFIFSQNGLIKELEHNRQYALSYIYKKMATKLLAFEKKISKSLIKGKKEMIMKLFRENILTKSRLANK